MKNIFNINKYISLIVISLQSNIGTCIMILFLVLVDGVGSAFGVASIFRARFEELNSDTAFKMSLIVGGVFSSVLLLSIVISSLKKSMKGVNAFTTFVSACLSFVGFVKFILPTNYDVLQMSFDVALSLIIAFFLALVPAVLIKHASDDLTSDKANNEEVKKLTQQITKQAAEALKKQFESMVNKPQKTKENKFIINKAA